MNSKPVVITSNDIMKVSVWDTYVKRTDGLLMHFDILVPTDVIDEQTVFNFGMDYLRDKSFQTDKLSTKECRLCHVEHATKNVVEEIESKGYSIIEFENCQ